jgi:hypothetical protein
MFDGIEGGGMTMSRLERFERIVHSVFGTDACLAGTFGTVTKPEEFRIVLGGRTLGRGPNFAEAFASAIAGRGVAQDERRPVKASGNTLDSRTRLKSIQANQYR